MHCSPDSSAGYHAQSGALLSESCTQDIVETLVTWDGLVEPSHVAKTNAGSTLYSAGVSQNSLHLFGKAKATISSFVTSEPVRLPPVLTTVTNCRPSAPIYVAGVASIDDGSLVSQSC
jgi:hypothetical protein